MPLDPQVQAVLDKIRDAGNPEYWQMTPAQARDWHNRKAGLLDVKPEPVFLTRDWSVPGPAGGVPVRIYVPRPPTGLFPVLARFGSKEAAPLEGLTFEQRMNDLRWKAYGVSALVNGSGPSGR